MSADPAVFLGRVDADGRIHLEFRQQQIAYCKRKLAGKCVDVIVCEQGELKTRLQEAGYHAMLGPWVKEGHRIEDLKRFCLLEIFGTREVTNPITGNVTLEPRETHTSTLSRAKYSELIEGTLEIAAGVGVLLEAPSEWTARKDAERKAHERKQAKKGKAA